MPAASAAIPTGHAATRSKNDATCPRPVDSWLASTTPEIESLLARVAAAGPVAEEAAQDSDRERRLADRSMAALHEQGLFRLLLPRDVGGEEITLPHFLAVIKALARFDGSAAWCVCQGNACAMLGGYIDRSVASEIWVDDPRAVLAWGPGDAQAKAVEGGYSVAASNNFVSGSHHATWLAAHCTVVEYDGTQRVDSNGLAENRTVLFPASVTKLADQWDAVGLRGTGSDAFAVEDLFVPTERTIVRTRMIEDAERRSSLHGLPLMAVYAVGFAGVALGIARGFLNSFMEMAQEKRPRGITTLLRDNPLVHDEVARSEARLAAASALLNIAAEEGWRDIETSDSLTLATRMGIRLAGTHATHEAKATLDMLMDAAGSSAIFASGPFERRFRDIHSVALQAQARKAHYQTVGGWMFGLPVDTDTMW